MTSFSGRKARNLAARPEATLTAEDRSTLERVSAADTAELIRGRRSAEINARLYRRYWADAGLETVGPLLKQTEGT